MRRLVAAAALAAALLVALAGPASAHPLGNFTVNRFTRLEVQPQLLLVHHVLDMAEIPTFQERRAIDANGDDELTPAEADAYAQGITERLAEGLRVTVDGREIPLSPVSATGGLGEGQGGLAILRIEADYRVVLPKDATTIEFEESNEPRRRGWREIVAAGCGVELEASTVPRESISRDLRAYPQDLLSDPLDVRRAELTVGGPAPTTCPQANPSNGPAEESKPEGFAGLIARDKLSPGFVLLATLLAVGFGALHALGPGHGKTITVAYLIGAKARVGHALRAGVAIAAMHTISVLALGLLTLWATSAFPPETVYPWLGLITGIVVFGLGLWLLRARLRGRANPHEHGHDHGDGHDHAAHGHSHVVPAAPLSRQGLAALAVGGGLLPSPTAVVVLTGAIALGRLAFGLVLVMAFSVGLALALALIGLAALRIRTFAEGRASARLTRVLPLVSAVAVVGAGVFLAIRAAQTF